MLIYLGLGANIGQREQTLKKAVEMINERIGNIVSLSAFYDSAPSGFLSDNRFLNGACCLETQLDPFSVLEATEQIERELGRASKSQNQNYKDRSIDIDILLVDDRIISSERLTVPHRLMHERDFVLIPLAEIAPDKIHPLMGKSIATLRDEINS